MNVLQKALFPAILLGSLILYWISQAIGAPQPLANAAPLTPTEVPAVEEVSVQTAAGECVLPARYPESIRQWCDLVQTSAAEHGIDAALIASVMLQESGGDPQAYSKSGAVGLMQVMPRDGIAAGFNCINGPCFASRPSMEELFDPGFNISYGARMLSNLIQKYGDVREALRAYGPMDMEYRYADLVLTIYENYRD